ncbi:hypothetical protein [Streptomyces sp. A0592]|uniref:hypothetical protein n=1 Tax=Streptomyces sp. A0592 TaxID=2563099 RepID=UPI00109EBFE4|nr:hypothetical protein [Streptomyces sp. A0592]THA81660.1 hypothetical protein E6U81_23310 [Streptomyces sp. A0592]
MSARNSSTNFRARRSKEEAYRGRLLHSEPSLGQLPHHAMQLGPRPELLGPTPGIAKLEGVQEMAWAGDLMEKGLNPARRTKGGDAVLDDGE